MARIRCRSFVREDASSRDSIKWFECGESESDRCSGHVVGSSSREAAIKFANTLTKDSVINFTTEYDEKDRRVVALFFWGP
jgi:hypothetical protein